MKYKKHILPEDFKQKTKIDMNKIDRDEDSKEEISLSDFIKDDRLLSQMKTQGVNRG